MKKELYELTNPQKSIWLTEQFYKGTAINTISGSLYMKEPLNFDKLVETIKILVKKHDNFRIKIDTHDNTVKQYLGDIVNYNAEIIDLKTEEDLDELKNKCATQVFDLKNNNLFNFTLFRFPNNYGGVISNVHHIISDSWTLGLISQEIIRIYKSLINNEELTNEEYSYVDYIKYEKDYMNSTKYIKDKEFWNSTFETIPEVASVPSLNKNVTDKTSCTAKRKSYEFSVDLVEKIILFCKNNKISVFNFITAIYSLYISRICNLKDFVIGTPILNRANYAYKNTYGMFINTAPLRINLKDTNTFLDLSINVAQNSMLMLKHQRYSYQSLLEDLRKRDSSIPNLYNVLISYQITRASTESSKYHTDWNFNGNSIDEFSIHISDLNDTGKLNISYDYKTDKYSTEEIEDLHKRIEYIIHQVLHKPAILLDDIEIVTEWEKNKMLNIFNNVNVDFPRNKTVVDLFEEQAERTPNNIAVSFNNKYLTYKQLNEKSNQLANYIIANGIKPKTVIGLRLDKCFEMIIGILAIIKSGCCYLPINMQYPKDRVEFMLHDSNAQLLLGTKNALSEIELDISKINIELDQKEIYSGSTANLNTNISPEDLIYIIYTSGSTGTPKGAMLCHRNIVRLFKNDKFLFDFNENDSWTMFHSVAFDFSVWEMYGALLYGGKLVLVTDEVAQDPELFLELMRKENVTILNQTPTYFYKLQKTEMTEKDSNLKIRYIIFGGEALKPNLLQDWHHKYPNTKLINMYGITETTVHVIYKDLTENDLKSPSANIGTPIPTLHVLILDNSLNLLPFGVEGEICVIGEGVFKGYLNREDLNNTKLVTKKAYTPNLIYKSGDTAILHKDGHLEYVGRIDNQVKIRGFRIELGEIEEKITKYSNIDTCIVTKKIDEYNREILCAYYIKNGPLDISNLRTLLSKHLPPYMIPQYFIEIDKVPININGKTDFKALPLPTALQDTKKIIKPRNEIDSKLLDIYKKYLHIENASITDSFYDLGGDSLTAIIICENINQKLNVNIKIKDILENVSIMNLSDFIANLKKSNNNTEVLEHIEKRNFYHLSSAQRRVYYATKIDEEDSVLYNMPAAIVFDKKPSIKKLTECFNTLIKRHSSLRTYFEVIDNDVFQKVANSVSFNLETNLNNYNVIDDAIKDFVKPFDLAKAPLFRVKLISVKNKFVLLFDMHHIISDGISVSNLINELCKLYNNEELNPLLYEYVDYSEWEYNKLKNNSLNDSKEFWTNQFKGEIPVLNMPTDYPRPAIQSFEGGKVYKTISNSLTKKINMLAKKLNVSNYVLLLSSYYILLSKYTSQKDIVVGTPSSGRNKEELLNIIGMFVSTLALKNHVDSNMLFTDFVNNIKTNFIDALEHQDYPFDELESDLKLDRDTSRNPLFDTMFIYQNNGIIPVQFNGLKSKLYIPDTNISKFDLTLEVIPETDKLNLSFEYCSKLFKKDTIERFSNHFINILETIVENSDIKISEIDILSTEERNKILYEFNNTKTSYESNSNYIDLFNKQVLNTPNKNAIIFHDKSITYKELNEKSNQIANYLIKNGIKSNDFVGLLVNRSLEMIIAIIGILKAGAAYIPIDPTYPYSRIKYMIEDSKLNVILSQKDLIESFDLNNAFSIDFDNSDIYRNYDINNLNIAILPENFAYLIYTSGSTGKPKGVIINHRNINNFITGMCDKIDFSSDKTIVSITTMCFDIFGLETLLPLQKGLTIVLADEEEQINPKKLNALCQKYNVDIIQTTPSKFSLLLADENELEYVKNLSRILLGGEAFPKKLLDKIKNITSAKIYNVYGPTETTIWSSIKDVTKSDFINIGKPIANTQMYILDENKKALPIGVPGELYIGGDGVSVGYYNREDLTKERFIENPFIENERIYRTGDLAKWLPSREIEYIGRTDFQVKLHGLRIELGEIEAAILNFEHIEKCVVCVKTIAQNRQVLCAYIISKERISISDLKKYISTSLPTYMVPTYFMQIAEFPYTLNGKIDRNALPLPNVEDNNQSQEYVAPRNNFESGLVEILEKVLNTYHISVLDNFFNLGGDSLAAILLATNIRQKFNIEISFKNIINKPIIEDLAALISKSNIKANNSIIKKCAKMDYYPTSSAQKRIYLATKMDNNSTLYNITVGLLLNEMPDIDKLQHVLKTIVARHESLRTYFEVIDGNIVQKIENNLKFNICLKEAKTNNTNKIFEENQSIFTLNKPPLFKVLLIKLPNEKTLLMLDVHHIIFDGLSFKKLIEEATILYNNGNLSILPITYKDYAVWENEQLAKDNFKDSKTFWIKQFEDDIPILNMPTSYPRSATKSYKGSTYVTSLSKDIQDKITAIAIKYNATPYMIMLCAYYILLYKYTNQEDIIVGSPASGRMYTELEPLIGMFVNSIPLRNKFSSSDTFEKLLQRVKDICIEAFAHQNYPFDELVNDLNIHRDTSRNSLFDTMFIYQTDELSNNISLGDLNGTPCIATSNTSKFDISVEVVPQKTELKLSFEYCLDLFNEDFINNFSKHYKNILSTVLENPEIKISNISMLSETEKNKILYDFNNTKLKYEKNKTIANLFEAQVEKTPNNIALIFENTSLTYKELNEKSNQLANYLRSKGVKEGSTVGIILPRSLEVLVAMLGVLKAGGCYIPIDPNLPDNRINYMLSNSNVNIVLIKNTISESIKVDAKLDINLNNSDIYSGASNNLNISVNPESPSYMIYTSGSTGTPKGVVLKHKSLTNLATYLNKNVEFLKDEYANIPIVSITTISFDIFIFETLICLQRGLKVIIANEAEQNTPNLLDDLIAKHNIKAIQMTPSRMYIFINNQNLMPHLNNLKYIVLAGEALPNDLLNRILKLGDIKVYNGYGPSETTVFSSFTDVTNYNEINIGRPLGNTRIYILDNDMNICPIGIPGEIYIAGDGVGIGYSNNEEITKEHFLKDIFYPGELMYKTGDLGKFLPNGEISYIGRIDNQIKIRGLRIELDEIEHCILNYPNIDKCIITSDTDDSHRQFIIAYLSTSDRVSISKLRLYLKNKLPNYMIPSYFIILDSIPYLNNGKINKKALPKPETLDSDSERAPYVAPTNKTEILITNIFQKLLSISPIGINDNFFDLGGDSLLAINLQVELLKHNLNITYSDIFMNPTVSGLASIIISADKTVFSSINKNEFEGFDTILDNTCKLPTKIEFKEMGNILITGATGFLGAHVLSQFLECEKGIAYCLIRPEHGLTLENKLIKKLHFYFGNKYDELIGSRIIIVNGDIIKNNFGMTIQDIESIANNISCVINCAAKVSHYGNYNIYKEVNVDGVENLLKFCLQFNKRFYQISTLSISGNSLVDQSYMEQSSENDIIFKENNFYINQSLDNVYVRSKFEAEKLVLQYILKGLDGYILRVGNLMNRFKDGKFQPNVDENAYINRLVSLAKIGCIPDYMLNTHLEFTPIDSCAESIIKLIQHPSKTNRIFHLYDHNHIDVSLFIKILKKYINIDIVSNEEFMNKINDIFRREDADKILSGILRDFDTNKKLIYESNVKVKSEFTIKYLEKFGYSWPKIDKNYLIKFLDYYNNLGYLRGKDEK